MQLPTSRAWFICAELTAWSTGNHAHCAECYAFCTSNCDTRLTSQADVMECDAGKRVLSFWNYAQYGSGWTYSDSARRRHLVVQSEKKDIKARSCGWCHDHGADPRVSYTRDLHRKNVVPTACLSVFRSLRSVACFNCRMSYRSRLVPKLLWSMALPGNWYGLVKPNSITSCRRSISRLNCE